MILVHGYKQDKLHISIRSESTSSWIQQSRVWLALGSQPTQKYALL